MHTRSGKVFFFSLSSYIIDTHFLCFGKIKGRGLPLLSPDKHVLHESLIADCNT